jgi:periplasmic protein TonB
MRLLESEAAPERRGGGTMTSMVVHAAIIAGTVLATMRADAPGPRDVPIPPEIVYRAPVPDLPRQATASTGGATGATTGTVTIPVPTVVPVGIPTIDMTVDVPAGPSTTALLGGPTGGTSEGGFGGSPSGGYGAPDVSGAWDAHTVEVPVVPDARNPSPRYPDMLRSAGMTGRVVAEFVVDSGGRVRAGSLVIVESTHELFASSVRRTVPSFRFTPARVRGQRVAQRVRVPFEFEISR